MRRILVTAGAFQRKGEKARAPLVGAGFEVVDSPREGPFTEDDLIPLLHDSCAVIASTDRYTEKVFAECPDLRVVSRWGAGIDSVDVEAATRHGIVVANTPGFPTESVADMTFGLMICIARGIVEADSISRARSWREVKGVSVH